MAKLGTLFSIGHNLAHSVGSGIGLLVGYYEMDIYGEAARSREKYIEVDFLNGTTTGAKPSRYLKRALRLYSEKALPDLCRKHRVNVGDFKELKVKFFYSKMGEGFDLFVENALGKSLSGEYRGSPARRLWRLDEHGRRTRAPLVRGRLET